MRSGGGGADGHGLMFRCGTKVVRVRLSILALAGQSERMTIRFFPVDAVILSVNGEATGGRTNLALPRSVQSPLPSL